MEISGWVLEPQNQSWGSPFYIQLCSILPKYSLIFLYGISTYKHTLPHISLPLHTLKHAECFFFPISRTHFLCRSDPCEFHSNLHVIWRDLACIYLPKSRASGARPKCPRPDLPASYWSTTYTRCIEQVKLDIPGDV